MKKILISVLFALFSFTASQAELGMNIGLSGTMGVFHAEATETESDEIATDDATGVFGYGSIFVEKDLGIFTFGVDYVPSSLESETAENVRLDKTTTDTRTSKTNSVKVEFEDLTTLYAAINLGEHFFVKAGMIDVDVNTKESLATGSTYGNTSLDGTVVGIGFNNDLDNGLFVRMEGQLIDFDGVTITSSNTDNKVQLKSLEGASASLSIGKSF